MTLAHPPTTPPTFDRAHAHRCAHCNRPLTQPGYRVPYVGVVGPECRHRFGELLRLAQTVEGLRFDAEDQGSLRLMVGIRKHLWDLGFEVQAATDYRASWLEINSRRVTRKGADMAKRYKQARASIDELLAQAGAEQEQADEGEVVTPEAHITLLVLENARDVLGLAELRRRTHVPYDTLRALMPQLVEAGTVRELSTVSGPGWVHAATWERWGAGVVA